MAVKYGFAICFLLDNQKMLMNEGLFQCPPRLHTLFHVSILFFVRYTVVNPAFLWIVTLDGLL